MLGPIENENSNLAAAVPESGKGSAPRRRSRRKWRCIVLSLLVVVLLVAVGVLGGVGWVGSERAIHQGPKSYPWHLADFPALHPERVTLPSTTGITISGTFFPGRSRTTIIISHGYGNDQNEVLPFAAFLQRAGYSVFTYDMRSRGGSGGDAITMGALEQYDLVSVVDYLVARPDVDREHIGAMGVSLGGATTILAAARDPHIKAVVDDCGFTDIASATDTAFQHFIGLPAFPFSPITVKISEWRIGQSVAASRPIDVVGKISPRPLLIIHGLEDKEVPPAHSERLYAAAGNPKDLWLVTGAGHGMNAWQVATPEFERRVISFFRQYLGE
jgi:dipeptidyl aminopeptidase/acylaminoacyl peptidase